MGLFSGGTSQSTSTSYSGLRGTKEFTPLAEQLGEGYKFGIDTAKQRVGEMNPLGLNASGLTDSQMSAFNTLGKNLFSGMSSNYAGRGFLNPENVSGVLGSSLAQAAPQLMDQIYKNQMGQQQVLSDRFGTLRGLLDTGTGLAGSQSSSTSYQKGANQLGGAVAGWASPSGWGSLLQGVGSVTGGGGGAAAAMCWVADALYGVDDMRTHLARWYVNTILPKTLAGRAFRAVYRRVGPTVAKLIPHSPALRALLSPLFDRFWMNGAQLLSR